MNTLRILADIALLLFAAMLPWWCTLPLAFFASFIFTDYVEMIFFGFLIDALTARPLAFDFQFFFTAISFFLYVFSAYLRTKIVLYD